MWWMVQEGNLKARVCRNGKVMARLGRVNEQEACGKGFGYIKYAEDAKIQTDGTKQVNVLISEQELGKNTC